MADAHAHDEHGDDYHVHTHITSIKTYVLIFGALIFLTLLTVAAYNVRLGEWNLFVAVLIAMVKSSLVGAYFMHLKYEKKFNILFFTGSLIFVGVFLAYTLNDTDYRGNEGMQGMRIDPATGSYAYGTAAILGEDGEFTPFPEEIADEAEAAEEGGGTEATEAEEAAIEDAVEDTVDDDATPAEEAAAEATAEAAAAEAEAAEEGIEGAEAEIEGGEATPVEAELNEEN